MRWLIVIFLLSVFTVPSLVSAFLVVRSLAAYGPSPCFEVVLFAATFSSALIALAPLWFARPLSLRCDPGLCRPNHSQQFQEEHDEVPSTAVRS